MSDNGDKQSAPIVTDAVLSRIEKYGLATLLLIGILYWARPHLDDLFRDHRQFLRTAGEAITKQAEAISGATVRLQKIEESTTGSERLLRDIHGRVMHAELDPPPAAVVDR